MKLKTFLKLKVYKNQVRNDILIKMLFIDNLLLLMYNFYV